MAAQGKQAELEKMAALQALNERIVAARRRGDEAEMQRLKAQAQALLLGGFSSPATQEPAVAVGSKNEERREPREDTFLAANPPQQNAATVEGFDTAQQREQMGVLLELRIVNQQIVEARRLNDDARVKVLQTRAEKLMKMGILAAGTRKS